MKNEKYKKRYKSHFRDFENQKNYSILLNSFEFITRFRLFINYHKNKIEYRKIKINAAKNVKNNKFEKDRSRNTNIKFNFII